MANFSKLSQETAENIVKEIHGLRIVSRCGDGAFGSVFLCRDAIDRLSAIKIVDKAHLGENWLREFNGLLNYCKNIDSETGLINIFHVSDHDGYFCCLLEAADSIDPSLPDERYQADTLQYRLDCGKSFSPEDIIRYMQILIGAVAVLHKNHLVHRDIKPDNILFVKGSPKLSDTSLITCDSGEVSIAGTPGFMPPEFFSDTECFINSREQDIYALGKVLYCMLSGLPPKMYPDFPEKICADKKYHKLCRFTLKACSTNQQKRFHSIEEFAKEFNRMVCGQKNLISKRALLLILSGFTAVFIAIFWLLIDGKSLLKHYQNPVPAAVKTMDIQENSGIPGALPLFYSDFSSVDAKLILKSEPQEEELKYSRTGAVFAPNSAISLFQFDLSELLESQQFEIIFTFSGEPRGNLNLSIYDADAIPDEDPHFPAKELMNCIALCEDGSIGPLQLQLAGDTVQICNVPCIAQAEHTIRLLRNGSQLSCSLNETILYKTDCSAFFQKYGKLKFRGEVFLEENTQITLKKLIVFQRSVF